MSVLIKGMKMPTRCGECPCAYSTEGAYWDTCQAVDDQNDIEHFWKSGRPDWCPLVEVPIPHGRLIDADKMVGDLLTVDPQFEGMIKWSITVVEAQPTIIEAEGGE